MNRAYSLLTIKSADDDRRIITGLATTPDTDRVGDVIEPLGVSFKNPLPLLLHHDKAKPVGTVTFKKPTADGVEFTALLPRVEEPGVLKDRTDEAWQSIKHGLIRGVSVGFRSIEEAFNKDTGGFRFLQTEVMELSLVTVPANASATIHSIKQFDQAASGLHSPGATGLPVVQALKGATPMTTQEQISQFENTRAAKVAEMTGIMSAVAEKGETLDQAQTEKYDGLALEVKSIDAHLPRLRELEKANLASATAITTTTHSTVTASELRGGNVPVIAVKSNHPKGTHFTRMAMSLAAGKGDSYRTIELSKQWKDTPEVELMVKAAIAAGSTTDATFAGPLVVAQPLVDEFLELLRPKTLIGRIPGLRQVPFNVSVPTQTAGGTYSWVGQNKPKPLTNMALSTVTLGFAKAAGIIVLTEELVKFSSPSAEATVRNEMIAGIAQFLDGQFTDPAIAAVANVNPASITNGAPTAIATGTSAAAARADLIAAIGTFTAAELSLGESVWLMNESNAFAIGMSLNALGQPSFPGFNGTEGGRLLGVPVVITNVVSNRIVLVHTPSILFADDGGVSIDVSREASLQMDSTPADPVDATTVYVSLWQRNLVGLRAERYITWLRARTAAVRVITGAAYTGA